MNLLAETVSLPSMLPNFEPWRPGNTVDVPPKSALLLVWTMLIKDHAHFVMSSAEQAITFLSSRAFQAPDCAGNPKARQALTPDQPCLSRHS